MSNAMASPTSWVDQVKREYNTQDRPRSQTARVCIYRVPESIKNFNREAYDPLVVSLGPYHHKNGITLSVIDQLKVETVHKMLDRAQKNVATLIEEIRKLDDKTREYYEEKIDCDGETLSWMLAMDACFIVEFLRSRIKSNEYMSLIFGDHEQHNTVYRNIEYDFMKLENQIPFFILETALFVVFENEKIAKDHLIKLLNASRLFQGYPFSFSPSDNNHELNLEKHINNKPRHLLDLHRMVITHLLTSPIQQSASHALKINKNYRRLGCRKNAPRTLSSQQSVSHDNAKFTPRAELLVKTGIKFEKDKLCYEKRRFGRSKICLYQINVDDSTEVLLRNLMAYEECRRCSWSKEETVISQYVIMLQNLIDSEKDVSVLRKAEVIYSDICSDKYVGRIFNDIAREITFDSSVVLDDLRKHARKHCDNRYNVWMNQMSEEYFSKPWSLLSFIGAMLILGLTITQTANSFKSV